MTAHNSADLFRRIDPVWCDPPMVDLLAAAADTYRIEAIQPHHLLTPDGIVIFVKPMPVVWHPRRRRYHRPKAERHLLGRRQLHDRWQPSLGITGWQRAGGLSARPGERCRRKLPWDADDRGRASLVVKSPRAVHAQSGPVVGEYECLSRRPAARRALRTVYAITYLSTISASIITSTHPFATVARSHPA